MTAAALHPVLRTTRLLLLGVVALALIAWLLVRAVAALFARLGGR